MRVAIGILALAGLALLALWKAGLFEATGAVDPTQGGAFTVKRGDLAITLTERGTLKTSTSQQIRSMVQGRTSIQWLAEEGKRVKAGDVVVELDRTEVEREIDEHETMIIQLEAEERAAQTEVEIQLEQNETDNKAAELALRVAESELAMFIEGDDPAQLRKLQLALDNAVTERDLAQERLRKTREMREKDFVTAEQVQDEEIKVRNAVDAVAAAEEDLHLYKKYKGPLDKEQKEAAKAEALRTIETARKQADARLEGKRANLTEKTRRLAQRRAQLEQKKTDLARMTITAPTDGVIIYGDPDRGWDAENIRVGGDAYYDHILMTIPDSSEMAVTINVHEADIGKVKEGMRATVRSELERGQTHSAVVAKIDSVANAGNRRWGETVRRFKVELKIEGADLDLKPGTSASVDLHLGKLEDVLHVPIQAVHAKEGRFACYVRDGGGVEEVPVKVGRSNDAFLEIVEGLVEGQEVLLYQPEPATVAGAKQEDGAAERASGSGRSGAGANGERRSGNRGGDRPSGGGPGRPQP